MESNSRVCQCVTAPASARAVGAARAFLSPGSGPGRERGPGRPSSNGEKVVVTLVKPFSAEVWVYRGRAAAVMSALILLTALIVVLVQTPSHYRYCVSVFYAFWVPLIMEWDKRNRWMLSWREPPTYRTIPHVSSCHVVLLHQSNAHSSGRRSVGADEI